MKLDASEFLELASAKGTLEIRAVTETRPVLEIPMSAGKPFLTTGSGVSLSLSDLTIQVHYPATAAAPTAWPPVIHAFGRRVQVQRCAFEVVGPRPDGCRALVAEGTSVTAEHCWFSGFDQAIQVKVYDSTVTAIRQTMVVPGPGTPPASPLTPELRGWALGIEITRAEGRRVRPNATSPWIIARSKAPASWTSRGDAGASPLPVDVTRCAVRTDALLAWQPHKPGDRLDVDLQWQGLGNQFHILGGFWIVQSARTMTPASSLDVTDLASWTRFVVRETDPNQTRILYTVDPHARPDPPHPKDLAIENADSPDVRAGADPEHVGPAGK